MSGYDAADDSRKSYDVCIAAMGEKLRSFRREQIGDATLYLGDCRELLPLLPKVDAVVTDVVPSGHDESTSRQQGSRRAGGEAMGGPEGRDRAALSQRWGLTGGTGGSVRGDAGRLAEGAAEAWNQAQEPGPNGRGKRSVRGRLAERDLSEDDREGLLREVQQDEGPSDPSHGRQPHEQRAEQPASSLLAVPHEPAQKRVVARSVLAVVTDPPYGIGADAAAAKNKGRLGWKDYGKTNWDAERPDPAIFAAILACSDEQIIWGGNYFTDYLPPSMQWLIWDKGQFDFSLADFEMAWSSQQKAARRIVYGRGRAVQDGKVHPTQKPVEVMMWCIEQIPHGRTILDPFMGSGTTGVACAKLGRKFIGIEIEPKYFDIACKRIDEAYRQPRLFQDAPPKPKQEALL